MYEYGDIMTNYPVVKKKNEKKFKWKKDKI